MTIPFSVFTAHHGYKWSNIPVGMSEAHLTRYEKTISGARPEYMNSGEHFDGILYDGSIIIVFTAMRVAEWDLAKRTAHYYALAFIPRTECRKVNIDQLLNYDWFKTPMREPPLEIEYTGGQSDITPTDVIDGIKSGQAKTLDFRYCGDLLSNNGHLGVKWQIFRTNVANWSGAAFVFEPNRLVFSVSKSVSSLASTFQDHPEDTHRAKSEKASIPLTRTISLDHSNDPAYQLELRIANKIKELSNEQKNNILALENLTRAVAKLKMAVCGLIITTLLLLVIAILDRNRIKALVMATTTSYKAARHGNGGAKKSDGCVEAKKKSDSGGNGAYNIDTTKDDSNANGEDHSSDNPNEKKGGK